MSLCLNVVMLNVVMLNIINNPFMLNVSMLSVVMTSVAMLSVIMPNFINNPFMLNVVMLKVVMTNVAMLSVVAPNFDQRKFYFFSLKETLSCYLANLQSHTRVLYHKTFYGRSLFRTVVNAILFGTFMPVKYFHVGLGAFPWSGILHANIRRLGQGILKGEVSLYPWPPVWLVRISLFCK